MGLSKEQIFCANINIVTWIGEYAEYSITGKWPGKDKIIHLVLGQERTLNSKQRNNRDGYQKAPQSMLDAVESCSELKRALNGEFLIKFENRNADDKIIKYDEKWWDKVLESEALQPKIKSYKAFVWKELEKIYEQGKQGTYETVRSVDRQHIICYWIWERVDFYIEHGENDRFFLSEIERLEKINFGLIDSLDISSLTKGLDKLKRVTKNVEIVLGYKKKRNEYGNKGNRGKR